MKLRKALRNFMNVIILEAERNPAFEADLRNAAALLNTDPTPKLIQSQQENDVNVQHSGAAHSKTRPSNRRPAAILDPVQLAREGELKLRTELKRLSIEQLRDVVADYGMDPGKVVMKWRTPARIVDRIVEVSLSRAEKGDAFREKAHSSTVEKS